MIRKFGILTIALLWTIPAAASASSTIYSHDIGSDIITPLPFDVEMGDFTTTATTTIGDGSYIALKTRNPSASYNPSGQFYFVTYGSSCSFSAGPQFTVLQPYVSGISAGTFFDNKAVISANSGYTLNPGRYTLCSTRYGSGSFPGTIDYIGDQVSSSTFQYLRGSIFVYDTGSASVVSISPTGGFSNIVSNPVTYSGIVKIPAAAFGGRSSVNVKMMVQGVGELGNVQYPSFSGFGGIGPEGGFLLNKQNQIYSHDVTQSELDTSSNFAFSVTNSDYKNEVVVTVNVGGIASSSRFTIDATTTVGQLNSDRVNTQIDFLNAQLATTSPDISSCGIGAFNLGGCTVAMLYVQQSDLNAALLSFLDSASHMWPLGYGTRLIEILLDTSASDQSELPAIIDTDLPISTPGAGAHLKLGFFDGLLQTGTILSTAQNPNTGHTLRDIVEPGWRDFVFAGAALIMIFEVLGISTMLGGSEMAANEKGRWRIGMDSRHGYAKVAYGPINRK